MPQINDYFTAPLKNVHVHWGNRPNYQRNPYEAYIKIDMPTARRLQLLKTGPDYLVEGQSFYVFPGGSQGACHEYGKNLESRGDLTLLGHYLIDELHAQVGDTIRVTWVTTTSVRITLECTN